MINVIRSKKRLIKKDKRNNDLSLLYIFQGLDIVMKI